MEEYSSTPFVWKNQTFRSISSHCVSHSTLLPSSWLEADKLFIILIDFAIAAIITVLLLKTSYGNTINYVFLLFIHILLPYYIWFFLIFENESIGQKEICHYTLMFSACN